MAADFDRHRHRELTGVLWWVVCWVNIDYWNGVAAADGRGQAAVALGEAIRAALNGDPSPHAAAAGVLTAAAGPEEDGPARPVLLRSSWFAEDELFLWSEGSLSVVPTDTLAVADLADAAPSGGGTSPVLLLTASAEAALAAAPADLGSLVYRMMADPGILELQSGEPAEVRDPATGEVINGLADYAAGILHARRGPMVSLGEECWVVWLGERLLDPSALSPSQMSRLEGKSRADRISATDEDLSLAGFVLDSGAFEETFVPAGAGQLSVFFGRNGAGKSLALTAIGQLLTALRNGEQETGEDDVRPFATLLLQAPRQEDAPQLFALVLAYLGWGPQTPLPDGVTAQCLLNIPAWDSYEQRPDDAPGLSVAELAGLPLGTLREAIADAIHARLPQCPGARVLADAIVSSPTLAVTADWQVGLALMPAPADPPLAAAAADYLAAIRSSENESDGAAVLDLRFLTSRLTDEELRRRITQWARQLTGELPPQPVLIATEVHQYSPWFGDEFSAADESGWRALGSVLAHSILPSVPRPVLFAPGRTTLQAGDDAAELALLTLVKKMLDTDASEVDAAPGQPRHPFAYHPDVTARIAARLEAEANRLLPRFVADAGAVKVEVAPMWEWHARRARASFTGGIDGEVALDALPSGLRTWALAAISFAAARLMHASWAGRNAATGADFTWVPTGYITADYGDPEVIEMGSRALAGAEPDSLAAAVTAVPKVVYLLDEPEAHLHLTAQRDVVDVAAGLAEASCGVVAATHSLSFLDARPATTRVVTLDPSNGRIRSSSWTGLRDLTEHADALGITPSALALACRGVLVVEGPHDKEIINRYGGVDLDKERIIIVPLQGADDAAGIAELEFLQTLRIPVHVLLDHVRADVIRAAAGSRQRPIPRDMHKEERVLLKLHHAVRERRVRVNVLPFPHVDIVRAVPEPEIDWALRELGKRPFPGWKSLDARAEAAFRQGGQKFKDTFEQVTGASVGKVIWRLIKGDRHGPRSPELHGILAAMLSYDPAAARPGLAIAPASLPASQAAWARLGYSRYGGYLANLASSGLLT